MARDKINYSLKEAQTREQERREPHGLQNASPFYIVFVKGVFGAFDFKCTTDDADEAEDSEIDPAGLSFEPMAEDDDEGKKEDGGVDANLRNSDGFLS